MNSDQYTNKQRSAYDQAQAAMKRLLAVFEPFGLRGSIDQAVLLAGLLTVVIRGRCMPAPLFVVSAGRGTGKGVLCNVVATIATGQGAPRLSQATGSTDQRMQVIAAARSKHPMVVVDNVARPLGNAKLDEALCAESWKVRLAGHARLTTLRLKTVWWATGNYVQFDPRHDTERRSLLIEIGGEGSAISSLPREPLEFATARQAELFEAVRTIYNGWALCKDVPRDHCLDEWGAFPKWSGSVRAIVLWLGMRDPVGGRLDARQRHRVPQELLANGQHPPGLG